MWEKIGGGGLAPSPKPRMSAAYAAETDRIFMKILSQMYLWIRKYQLNFGSPDPASGLRTIRIPDPDLFLASVAACNKTPAFPSNLIIQWIEVELTGDHSLLAMKLWRSDLMKLEAKNVKNDCVLLENLTPFC